jgi:hypothetical protein
MTFMLSSGNLSHWVTEIGGSAEDCGFSTQLDMVAPALSWILGG